MCPVHLLTFFTFHLQAESVNPIIGATSAVSDFAMKNRFRLWRFAYGSLG
jgi:hypothetical protein